jgi:mannose-6-phosphate isomerase-like protein (cupin superfamily)
MIVSESFVVADWTARRGAKGHRVTGLHRHLADDEAWIVLEGRLGFEVDGLQSEVPAGESMLVERGTPHTWWNAQDEPTRYLLVMTPRIHSLIEALHQSEASDFARIFAEHESELLE